MFHFEEGYLTKDSIGDPEEMLISYYFALSYFRFHTVLTNIIKYKSAYPEPL